MLERTMEDLIAAFPADFFPRHQLVLKGRQQSFEGVGRFDLLFTDQFGSNILMELKAVPARYEDASQLAKYRDAMHAQGDKRIVMWLVAPVIPSSVREFLLHIGIEYSEIHQIEFTRVAQFRGIGIGFESTADQTAVSSPSKHEPKPQCSKKTTLTPARKSAKAWHFNTDESEVPGCTHKLLSESCFALWGYSDTEQQMNKPNAGEIILFYQNKIGIVAGGYIDSSMAIPNNSIFGKQSEKEFKRTVRDLVSVSQEQAVRVSELHQMGLTVPPRGLCQRYPIETANEILTRLRSRQT